MSEKNEFKIRVPLDLARSFKGLSIDAGTSVVKFVYKSIEDHQETNSDDSTYGHLHLVSFPRRELSLALTYVQEHSVIYRGSDAERPTLYTTGLGCTQHGKLITESLNVKLLQLMEYDCFVKSFTYLAAHLPRTEFLEPFLDEAIMEPVEKMKKHMELKKKIKELNSLEFVFIDESAFMSEIQAATGKVLRTAVQDEDVPLSQAEPDMYPCLLAMCGSGFAFFKVEQDGSFKVVDLSNRGGRTFHGLGTQLTGYKTFSELIEAASKGNQHSLDEFSNEVFINAECAEEDKSIYSMIAEGAKMAPWLIFCFGKAVDSEGQFKREDLACSLLNCLLLDLVQCVQLICRCHDIKRVFFSGGFTSTPLVRRIITTEFARRYLTLLRFGSLKNKKIWKAEIWQDCIEEHENFVDHFQGHKDGISV